MNEKWRDYRKYTDQQLDDLLKGFAGHADYGAVVFEYQRRQNVRREAESKARHEKTQRLETPNGLSAMPASSGLK